MGKNAQRKRLEKLQKRQIQRQAEIMASQQHTTHQKAIELPKKKEAAGQPLPPIPGASGYSQLKMAAQSEDIIKHIQGKKVIAFLQEVFDCCGEKCIIEYTNYFQSENFACLIIPRSNYKDIMKYLSSYVVLFRTGYKDASVDDVKTLLSYISYIRSLGVRVVYYADDLIFWLNNSAPLVLAKASDSIIVTNETLRDILRKRGQVHQPINIVPTHMLLSRYDSLPAVLPKPLPDDKFKVLLTSQGRIGINHAYEICELANADPDLANNVEWIFNANGVAQIRSVVNRFRNLHKTYIDWLSLDEYYQMTKSVDLIIHPAAPDDLAYMCPEELRQTWLDSKSEVKYTLAGAARIPIISSPTASYKDAIKDGETGFIANTPAEFVAKIKELKNDPDLCRKVGLAARKDVEQRYDAGIRYPQYRDAIIGTPGEKKLIQPLGSVTRPDGSKGLFIPAIEGGPRTFYENMKRWIPVVTNNKWVVVDDLREAEAGIAIAFVLADELMKAKTDKLNFQLIYRLDGLPMNFAGEYDRLNLDKMQELFRKADKFVWQSKHCLKMWRDRNLVPPEVNPEGPIIHNGVDLTIFKDEGPGYQFPNAAKYNFLNLNWSTFQHKRLDILKQVIQSYADNPDVRFFLIGNYVSTSQIQNVNFWRGVPNVTYLGQMRNQTKAAKEILASIYRAATALIFTSEMEGSPNTVLEALGCGCPVIYNPAVDIVPEILGDACLPLERMAEIFEMEKRQAIRDALKPIAEEYSIENCCRKYIQVLGE